MFDIGLAAHIDLHLLRCLDLLVGPHLVLLLAWSVLETGLVLLFRNVVQGSLARRPSSLILLLVLELSHLLLLHLLLVETVSLL